MPAQQVGKIHAHFDHLPEPTEAPVLSVWRCDCDQEFYIANITDDRGVTAPKWKPVADNVVVYDKVEAEESSDESGESEAAEPVGTTTDNGNA